MRWSKTLVATLREDPLEAEIPSHKLMLRAGLIRKLSGGLYTFLPLGLKALRKVERIIREEMDKAGALEVLMPALQPREVWDQSHRYDAMGDVMFRLKDRQERELVLGPTHEEVITDMVSREIKSYRQLPKTFYQIQTKFRDEIRPRFGLMRAKEFIMKDAYSFDLGWEQADASYKAMYEAYVQIFKRCGLRTKIVEADTGAMGGKWSHEFMVLAESGEDGLVECSSCSYAANLERAERSFEKAGDGPSEDPYKEVSTPGKKTIEDVSVFLGFKAEKLIKTLIYVADGKPVAALVPGNRDLNEKKLSRLLGVASITLADASTIARVTGAPVGFAGPVGLQMPIYADESLNGSKCMVAGANKADTHLVGITLSRDANVTSYADICVVKEGDMCPKCKHELKGMRGIEVGHVFKLGTKYTESFGADYLDEKGQKVLIVMGCYGIGVTRTLQSVVEQMHDENGINWPMSIAPYQVAIVVIGSGADTIAKADKLAVDLESAGVDVLLDDRDERPGVKFKDADLIGFPVRIVVSDRSLAQGKVEVKLRMEPKPQLIDVDNALSHVVSLCRA